MSEKVGEKGKSCRMENTKHCEENKERLCLYVVGGRNKSVDRTMVTTKEQLWRVGPRNGGGRVGGNRAEQVGFSKWRGSTNPF